jgi:GNAT superfamily N-acetyltransferase
MTVPPERVRLSQPQFGAGAHGYACSMSTARGDGACVHHSGAEASQLLDDLCDAYADAYGVEPTTDKTSAFRGRTLKQLDRPGFDLVAAHIEEQLVGFAFGYTLGSGTVWWDGLEPTPTDEFRQEDGARTFVLSEIEVRRAWQEKGVGRELHDALLGRRQEQRATLATGPDALSQAVYERWGWRKVGRVPGADGDYYSAYDLFVVALPLELTR